MRRLIPFLVVPFILVGCAPSAEEWCGQVEAVYDADDPEGTIAAVRELPDPSEEDLVSVRDIFVSGADFETWSDVLENECEWWGAPIVLE